MNLGTDPVHGKRDQANVVLRVEALDGLHEADVAFLDQVVEGQSVAGVALGDMNNKAQMRHNELARSVEVFLVAEAHEPAPVRLP